MQINVSVLMSVFNGERYLYASVASILEQTFRDFEFIIINDGSTDSTTKILADYVDPRIIVINNDANIGLTKSLNKGLKIAQGEYIARMDADDISCSERLEKQIRFLESNAEIGLLGTSWTAIDEGGLELSYSKAYSGYNSVHFMCHGSVMIRKTCLNKVGGYREVFKYAQDYDLWLRLREVCEVANLGELLYKLRISEQSITSMRKTAQDLFASLALDMAEERRRYGKDRLHSATPEEGAEICGQKLNLKGLRLRKTMSKLRATWAEAALQLGEYRRAFGYAKMAIKSYPLNLRCFKIISIIIFKMFDRIKK